MYVQFWFRRFRSGIFDVKGAPRTCRHIIENIDKITKIIEIDRHVGGRCIAQELKINDKTVLMQKVLSIISFAHSPNKKEARCLGAIPINTKTHDGHHSQFQPSGLPFHLYQRKTVKCTEFSL
ncbi:hypothetical protein TNCV_1343321 [Trichonephila clavipes]|nr:hypothetical protein TNCV_1343321 [Trichonephila clavipes]